MSGVCAIHTYTAVAARKHPEKGEVPDAYVILREGIEASDLIRDEINKSVENGIGKFARPANVIFVEDLPKTRSGKIMRRLLEDISNNEELGDTTTLSDPTVAEKIRAQIHKNGK